MTMLKKNSNVLKINRKTPKHLLLLFVSLLTAANVSGQGRIMPFLYLEDKKGETTEIQFTDGSVSIMENKILIGTPGKQFDFDYDDVERFYFKDCYKASLLNVAVSEGELTPGFDGNVLNYAVNVPYNISSITITATANDESATITGDGLKNLATGENSFTVTVSAEDGEITLKYTIIVNRASEVTGIISPEGEVDVKIYPNPTDGKLTVHIPNVPDGWLFTVYNMQGQKIETGIMSDEYTEMDIHPYPEGVYLLEIITKTGQTITKKLVKQ